VDAERLKKIGVFSSLSDEELDKLASFADETSIAKGEKLTKAGQHSYQLFAIEDGEVEVHRDGDTVATLGPGEVVGETGVVGRGLRNADVVAITDEVRAIFFTQDQVKRMRKNVPEVGEKLEQILQEREGD
jgi:CRP/FNR family transcriptional regulator, cyclic AMP receptor protein